MTWVTLLWAHVLAWLSGWSMGRGGISWCFATEAVEMIVAWLSKLSVLPGMGWRVYPREAIAVLFAEQSASVLALSLEPS